MRVTITAPNVFDSYGRLMTVGSTQTVDDAFGQSLVSAQRATDTDGVLNIVQNDAFSTGRTVKMTNASSPTMSGASASAVRSAVTPQFGLTYSELGDSHFGQGRTREGWVVALDPTVGFFSSRMRSFTAVLNAMLGKPMRLIYAGGVTGETVTQIAAREDICFQTPPNILFENGGANDVSSLTTLYSDNETTCQTAIVSSRTARWQRARKEGVAMVVALDLPPVNSTFTGYTAAMQALRVRVNNALAEAAKSYPWVQFIQTSDAVGDASNATGYGKSTCYVDDRHMNDTGSVAIARLMMLNQAIMDLGRRRSMVSSALDCLTKDAKSNNLMDTDIGLGNGTPVAATGTGISGTRLPFLTPSVSGAAVTMVCSVLTAPSGVGNAQRGVVAAAVQGTQARFRILPSGINTTNLPPGSWGYFECMVKITGGIGVTGISGGATVTFTGSTLTSPLVSNDLINATNLTVGSIVNDEFTVVSPPVYFPADATGLTNIEGNVFVTFTAGGGATIDAYQMRWIKM